MALCYGSPGTMTDKHRGRETVRRAMRGSVGFGDQGGVGGLAA